MSKTDADSYVTKYTYNALDFVTQINYNGGKQVSYRYNKVGELVEIPFFWTGYDIVITGDVSLVGIGGTAGYVPGKGFGAKLSIGVGAGVFFDIRPSK